MGGRVLSHGLFCFSCRKQRLARLLGPPHEIPQLQSHQGAPEGRGCFGLTSFTCMESVLAAVWVPPSSGPGVCCAGCPCSVPFRLWQPAFLCWEMCPRDRHSWVSIPTVRVALVETEAVAKLFSLVSSSKFSRCCLKRSFL